jgi:hypothetical protein
MRAFNKGVHPMKRTRLTDTRKGPTWLRWAVAFCPAAAVILAGGCSEIDRAELRRTKTEGWAQLRLPGTSKQAAFDAGVYAMRQWFNLRSVSAERGLIEAIPAEYEQKGGTGRIRDAAIGYTNRMRRTGAMMVEDRGTGCVVKCRIGVQRLDTADHRVFRQNEQFGDLPTETPIDREAGVSPQQNRVWTDMPRDKSREREILAVVRNRVTSD